MKTGEKRFIFNVIFYREGDVLVGHCLELDIVATGSDIEEIKKDLGDLITTQLRYAIENDNMEYLYKPAPPEIWDKFFRCKRAELAEPSPIHARKKGLVSVGTSLQYYYA